MEIKFKVEGLDAVKSLLNPDIYKKAMVRSINRAADKGFNAGSKKIREMYNFKAGDIKKEAKIFKASWSKQYAVIDIYSDSRTSFKRFGARQTRKGVSFKIRKDRGRSLLKGAFVINSLGGHVYKRTGEKRKMLKGRYKGKVREVIEKRMADISIAELFGSRFVYPYVEKNINETIYKEFKTNWNYYASRAKRRN